MLKYVVAITLLLTAAAHASDSKVLEGKREAGQKYNKAMTEANTGIMLGRAYGGRTDTNRQLSAGYYAEPKMLPNRPGAGAQQSGPMVGIKRAGIGYFNCSKC